MEGKKKETSIADERQDEFVNIASNSGQKSCEGLSTPTDSIVHSTVHFDPETHLDTRDITLDGKYFNFLLEYKEFKNGCLQMRNHWKVSRRIDLRCGLRFGLRLGRNSTVCNHSKVEF